MRSFAVQIFSFFRTLCGYFSYLHVFIVIPFISSTGLAIVAEANLRFGDILSEKNCRHSTGSFSFFLILSTRHPLSFHKFERQSCFFDVDKGFFIC